MSPDARRRAGTTAQASGMLDRYRRQVAMYAWLVGRATGRNVQAVVLRA